MHARLLSNAKDVLVTVLKCQPSVSDSLLLSFMNVLEFTWISIPESPSPPPLREIGCSLIGATDEELMGRKTHARNTCAQVAASEHLYDAIFRCKQAPSVLEIFLDNSMQQKNEQALERARDCKEVV